MTSPLDLGRLEKVELRNVWANEAGDFTPWLARDENIALVGEAIGLDLEVEAQEKFVGLFRADILCKDTARDEWGRIEDQLERTNHGHLGQCLSVASAAAGHFEATGSNVIERVATFRPVGIVHVEGITVVDGKV